MAVVYRTQVNNATRSRFAALVIAAHFALIYAIAVSLGVVKVPPIVKDSELIYIAMPKSVEESPPKPKPQKTKPVELPTPVPVVAAPTETSPLIEPVDESVSSPESPIESASLSVTKRVEPAYPPASRRAGEAGQVHLRVLVDESGHPIDVRILRSSGFDRLDEAAVIALKHWLFAPARQGSGPVTAWTQVNVTFRLED